MDSWIDKLQAQETGMISIRYGAKQAVCSPEEVTKLGNYRANDQSIEYMMEVKIATLFRIKDDACDDEKEAMYKLAKRALVDEVYKDILGSLSTIKMDLQAGHELDAMTEIEVLLRKIRS